MPQISVIMSVYNEPIDWVRQSIDSILTQTFSDFEFIIINDNPNNSEIQQFLYDYAVKDDRIKLIENEGNIGLTKSLNKGISYATGKYIARMDADDISYPKRLEKQFQYMESHPEVIVCGTRVKYFGKKSALIYNTFFEKDTDIRGQMFISSGFAHPSVIIRREILFSNNIRYDETFITAQDYKLWFDLNTFGKFANLKEVLLKYRLSSAQISSSKKESQISNRDRIRHLFKLQYAEEIESAKQLNNKKYYDKIESYLFREQVYYNKTFKNIIKFWVNYNTAATIKEKFITTLSKFKDLIKKHRF